MSCNNPNYIRYIPPVDTPCWAPYVGRKPPTIAAASTVQNSLGTNPRCPVKICNQCANRNCKCNLDHMRAPALHRYWVYKWNQY